MAAPSVKAAPTIEVNISPQVTNSPTHDQQLAIEAYWQGVDPLTFLPGSINAADRFARVSFLINAIPRDLDPAISLCLGLNPVSKRPSGDGGSSLGRQTEGFWPACGATRPSQTVHLASALQWSTTRVS
jgi:hypothetical protein